MSDKRVQLNKLVKNQLPSYVKEDFPLIGEFLTQYYLGQEYQGAPADLLENIDKYIKLDECGDVVNSTTLYRKMRMNDTFIVVVDTEGFPESNGLIRIEDEIIHYESKSKHVFENVTRGFSGITSFENNSDPEDLVFSTSEIVGHRPGAVVENLNVLFLKEFLKKVKTQFLPALQDKSLFSDLNQSNFIRNSKSLYSTRGTDESFKILFKSLYNEDVSIVRPIDYVIAPSNADYQKTRDLIVEPIYGDPEDLLNKTLHQDPHGTDIARAYAPVSSVEKISTGTTESYYRVSIDGGFNQNDASTELLYGQFETHAKTKIIGNVGFGQTFLDVDSTLGFPNNGTISIVYTNGVVGELNYTHKSVNQFLGLSFDRPSFDPRPSYGTANAIDNGTIAQRDTYAYAIGAGTTDGIRVRIRSVLNDLNIPDDVYQQVKGGKVKIKTLGKIGSIAKENNWFFNTGVTYDIDLLEEKDVINNTYQITTKDDTIFKVGDKIRLIDDLGEELESIFEITDVFNSKSVLFRGTGITNISKLVKLRREITKVDSDIHIGINESIANVQNVYVDGKDTLIATNSLPALSLYGTDLKLNPRTQKVVFQGVFEDEQENITLTSGVDHNFFTGDAIYYTPEKKVTDYISQGVLYRQESIVSSLFDEGLYFVKRIDANTVKLAKSRSNLYNEVFVKVLLNTNNVTIGPNVIEKYEFNTKIIKPQSIFRKLEPTSTDGHVYETDPGHNGILINGVEILNYKSDDICYYGSLKSIDVVAGGEEYDVINPPLLAVTDTVGSGATGYCAVKGNFKEIRVLDTGFDYTSVPIVKITGGNGFGAKATAKLKTIPHEMTFNSAGVGSIGIGINTSTIGFSTFHRFREGERVIYDTFGRSALVGLTTGAAYTVTIVTDHTIKLHKTLNDAVVGLNTVTFTDFGLGNHALKSLNGKSILNTVQIENPGSGYENKQRTCSPIGINTALNTITIENHGYRSGEIIKYTQDPAGVSTHPGNLKGGSYYVTSVDKNTFKLSPVGLGTTSFKGNRNKDVTLSDFAFKTKQYVDITSIGVGTHSFNYPPIQVQLIGTSGLSSETSSAIIQPIVHGEITSVHLTNNGVGYGVSDILNFERNPLITLNSGRNSELIPVISDGKLVEVSIGIAGTDYNSNPKLSVTGFGTGAQLVPEVNSLGNIVSVKINKSGVGYGRSTTFINVISSGKGALFQPNIKRWVVNEFKKNEKIITEDDVIISKPLDPDKGLQCSYLYAPRSLRQVVYASDQKGKTIYGKRDLTLVNGIESNIDQHSPIIGWSYDGHPIYGPFGYNTLSGGSITQLKSGYSIELKNNRPSADAFPPEFFIEDFKWTNSTDDTVLDERNGRFCVTPEYPDGVYAYFATFNQITSSDGAFKNFKRPKFPYLIGNSFKSKPIGFNYKIASNQQSIDLNKTNWSRNTYPYSLDKKYSSYSYITESYKDLEQDSSIKFVESGSVDAIGIVTGGTNYQVGDQIIFEDISDNNFPASAKVSHVNGSGIGTISVSTSEFSNVKFYPVAGVGKFLGIHTGPHGFNNYDLVALSGINTVDSFDIGAYRVGVTTNEFTLTETIDNIGATGIVTYISVTSGNFIFPNIQTNDIVQIDSERFKILNIDQKSSRFRVLRQENGTTGVSHTLAIAKVLPRIFQIEDSSGKDMQGFTRLSQEFYFNPIESVGLGTIDGVGVGTTASIVNPGTGASEVFIPSRSIYLPDHKLKTGDKVTYSVNGGSSIGIATHEIVGNGSTNPNTNLLSAQSSLYVTNISADMIGLSTVQVGLGSTGVYAGIAASTSHQGLIYFLGIGTGVYHSLTYEPQNVVKANLDRNVVTVSTAGTHGLSNHDTVSVNVNPGFTTTTTIKFNKSNRKLIADPINFTASGIVTSSTSADIIDTITVQNHNLKTGQKIIHTSTDPSVGLLDQQEYYVYVIDRDTVKLGNSRYNVTKEFPEFVGISSAKSGTISPINPPIEVYQNSTVNFDLTDSSLSYPKNALSFPAFKFEIYTDRNLTDRYVNSGGLSDIFDVSSTGEIGVSSDAKVSLRVDEFTPKVLYYTLTPLNEEGNLIENSEIATDNDVHNGNEIIVRDSHYTGDFKILTPSFNTFTYSLGEVPERSSYTEGLAKLKYSTISPFAYGPISDVELYKTGKGYSVLPGITTVKSRSGSGAILETFTESIGKVKKTKIDNIGYDYPSDLTLEPEVLFPQILTIKPLTGFKSIGITSYGFGYNTAPSLVVLDGSTGKLIDDVKLRYVLDQSTVDILENTNDLSNTEPTILPVGNPNGIRASDFSYNISTQKVTVTLKNAFSTDFPFAVNDRVIVENVSVGVGSTGLGYNSSDHNYALFTIEDVTSNLGGLSGIVTYSMAGFIETGKTAGNFDSAESSATLTPEKWFPQFSSVLKPNDFRQAESINNGISVGKVYNWNNFTKKLIVESSGEFEVGTIVRSPGTGDAGIVAGNVTKKSKYELDYFSTVEHGWRTNSGFLNNESQRIHDNDYYQSFSYAVGSKVPIKEWKDVVNTLNHTAGFKKFSDLQIESALDPSKVLTLKPRPDTTITNKIDLISTFDLNCVANFDLASENHLRGSSGEYSDEIIFNTRLITDYTESISNRVLSIDDISGQFNNNPRSTPYADVTRNRLTDSRVQKFITFISDRLYTTERQIIVNTVLTDSGRGVAMINSYGAVDTVLDLGTFDYAIDGADGVLRFYPNKFKLNNYNVVTWQYNLDGLGITNSLAAIGSTTLGTSTSSSVGDLVSVATTNVFANAGIAKTFLTLAGIGTTTKSNTRSAKIMVQVESSNDNEIEYDELNLIHDGTNVEVVEYGQLSVHSVNDPYSSAGNLGTYHAFLDGSDVKVTYTPVAGITTARVSALTVGISSEDYVGVGTYDLSFGQMVTKSTTIASSGSPSAVGIASYTDDYDAAYGIVQISDTTNSKYELVEVLIIDDGTTVSMIEYGQVDTFSGTSTNVSGLGTIGAQRTNSVTELIFTPAASINVSVKTFLNNLRIEQDTNILPANRESGGEAEINLGQGEVQSQFGIYQGTEVSVKRAFGLTHKTDPIFTKAFDGSDSTNIVNISANTIQLTNHFFTTGEEVGYAFTSIAGGISSAIGIGSTDFPSVGVGTTDLLPSSVFVIKVDDKKIKLASTAANALKAVPLELDLTSVGIGTSHSFVSKNPNEKVLVTIDNMIQSPIAGAAVSTTLATLAPLGDDIVYFAGITSFFGADYIKVDDEVMKILSVGVGATNAIKVNRGWLGTKPVAHASGSLVKKIRGDYNILDNTIHFIEAPNGGNPIATTTNPPSFRDWTGITTSSSFQGRVFTRSGAVGASTHTYAKNYLYDDISPGFDGQTKDFDLTVGGQNVTGVATNNAILMINGIFQGPTSDYNYTFTEESNTGISSIRFTGTASSVSYDPNNANIPVGGVIVSVATTEGFGYQPLVSAGGTAIVSTAGTITSVSIGNTGSGYRSGIQTVNVAIRTESINAGGITTIGVAAVSDGHVTGVTIQNPQFFYKPRNIINVGYSSVTGISTITTSTTHGLNIGDEVVLSGIAFTCDYAAAVGIQSAVYNNTTGIMTVTTSSAHGLSTTGKSSNVVLTGLAMTCGLGATVNHIYPRNKDVFYDTAISVASTTSTSITLNVTAANEKDQYTHTFVGAASSAIIAGGFYSHSFRYATSNAVTTGVGTQFTPTDATYDPTTGNLVLTIVGHGLGTNDTVGIGTSSIVFACEMDQYGSNHGYPRSTDPIAGINTAITSATSDTITIKVGTSVTAFYDVSAATYDATTGDLTLTIGSHTLLPGKSIKIAKESLRFTCSKDSNATQHRYPRAGDPKYDGMQVVGVASDTQFTVNVGTSTVATNYISGGIAQPAIIAPRANNNSATGQDLAYAGTSVIRVLANNKFEVNTGVSTRPHNYSRGGRIDKIMEVVFDDPLSYTNIPLEYASDSPSSSGGVQAKIDVVVGQGSSVIDFEITNTGYGYEVGHVLTIPTGGATGIPTTSSSSFREFQVTIDDVDTDKFTAWSVGELQVLDDFSTLFDGERKMFPISDDGERITLQAKKGSLVNVEDCTLVFLNDILQLPGSAYYLSGGSNITFSEAPKSGDTVKLLFYRGTSGIDVRDVEVIDTVKIGDTLTIGQNPLLDQNPLSIKQDKFLQQDKRTVTEIISASSVNSNQYFMPGLSSNTEMLRPIVWCRQTEDKYIEGKLVTKKRERYEPQIQPSAYIIKSVGIGSTTIFVDSARPFFNPKNEHTVSLDFQKDIKIINYGEKVSAAATAVVSTAGTITSIVISEGGKGYLSAPEVSIENPVGMGTTARAIASSTISGGSVNTITVGIQSGVGYAQTSHPNVLISPPTFVTEENSIVSYAGDFGIITGIGTTSLTGIATGLVFDLVIPSDSVLRNATITDATTSSGIETGFYFIVRNSNVGHGLTSLDASSNTVGVGTTFIDNIYRAAHVTTGVTTDALGFGQTTVTQVVVSVNSLNGLTGLGFSNFYGDYSWGKLQLNDRNKSQSYTAVTSNGYTGITTGPVIVRKNPLKFQNYSV